METPKPKTASPFDASPKAQLPQIDQSFFLPQLKEGQTTQQAYDAAQYDEDLRTGKLRPHFDKDGMMTLVKDTSTRVEMASAGIEETMESGPVGFGEQSLSVQENRINLARGTDYGSLSRDAKEESTASWRSTGQWWGDTGNMFKVWADRDTPEYAQLKKDLETKDETWDMTRKLAAVKQLKDSNPDLVKYAAANGFGIEDIALNSNNPFQFQAAVKEATRMAQLSTRYKTYNELTPHWYSEWALSARENLGEGLQDPGFMRDTIVTTIATAGLGGLGFAAARFGVMGGRAALAAKTVATQGMLLTGPMTGLVEGAAFRLASGTIFSGLGNVSRPIASRALGLFAEGATVGFLSSLEGQKDDYDWKSLVFNDKKHFEYDYSGAVTNSIGAGLLSTGMMSVMRLGIDATRIAATASFAPASFKANYAPKNFGNNLQSWTKNVANTFDNWATTADGHIIYGDQLGMGRGIAFMDIVDNHLRKFGDKRDFTKVMMNGSRLWGHFDPLTVSKMNYDMEAASKVSIEFEKATGIAGEAAMTGAAGHEAKALFGAMLDKGNLERMDLDYDDVKLLLRKYGEHGPQQRSSAEEIFLGESLKDKASPNRVEYRDHALRVERLLAVAGLDTKFRKNDLDFSNVLAVAEGHAGRAMDLGNTADFRSIANIGAGQRGLEQELQVQQAVKEIMGLLPKRAAEGHVEMPQGVHDLVLKQAADGKEKFYITDSEDPNYIVEVNLKDGTVTGSERKLVTDPVTGEIKIELDSGAKADFTSENIIRADTLHKKLVDAETKVRELFSEEYTNREMKSLEKKLKEAKDPAEKKKIKAIADAISVNKPVRVDTLMNVFQMDKVQAVASLVIMKALGMDDVNSSIEIARGASGIAGFTKGAVGQIEVTSNDLLGVNALVRATRASDMGTVVHEMGHFNDALFMGNSGRSKRHAIGISDEMFDAFKDWAGVEKGKDIHTASVAVREKIANGWSVYIQKALAGKATTSGPLTAIQRLFHRLGDNIGEIGAGFKSQGHLEKGFEISPAADRVFDMLLNRSNDKVSELFDVAYQKLWKNLDKDVREELGVSILGELRWNNYKAGMDKSIAKAREATDPLIEASKTKALKAEEITLRIEAATNSSISRRRIREWLKANPTMTEADVTARLLVLVTEAEALAAGKRTLDDTTGHTKVVVNGDRLRAVDTVTLIRLAAEAVANPDMKANVITRVDDVGLSGGNLYLAHSFMELNAVAIIKESRRRAGTVKNKATKIRKEAKAKLEAIPADAPDVVKKIATKAIIAETKAAILTEAGIPTKGTPEAVAVAEADLVLRDTSPELAVILKSLDTPEDIDSKLEPLETVITPVVVSTAIVKAADEIKAAATAVKDRVEVPTSTAVIARRKAKPAAVTVEEIDLRRQAINDAESAAAKQAEAELAQMKQEIETAASKLEETKWMEGKDVDVAPHASADYLAELARIQATPEYKAREAAMLRVAEMKANREKFMAAHEAQMKMFDLEKEWWAAEMNRPMSGPLAYPTPFPVWLAAREVALADKKFVTADGVEVALDTHLAISAVARQSEADNASAVQAQAADVISTAQTGTLKEAVTAATTVQDPMPRREVVNVQAKPEAVDDEVLSKVEADAERAAIRKERSAKRIPRAEQDRLDALAQILLDNPNRIDELLILVEKGKEKDISSEYFEAQVRHLITTRELDKLTGMDEAELRVFIDMKTKLKVAKLTDDQQNLLDKFQEDTSNPTVIARVEKAFGPGSSVRLTTYFRGLQLMANANTAAAYRASQAYLNNVVNKTKYEQNLAALKLHATVPLKPEALAAIQKSVGKYEAHATTVREGVLSQNVVDVSSVPKPTKEIVPLAFDVPTKGITREKITKAAKALGINEADHDVFLNKQFDFDFLESGSTSPLVGVSRLLGWMLGGGQGKRFEHAPATRQQIEDNPFLWTELKLLVLHRDKLTITEGTLGLKGEANQMLLLDKIFTMNAKFQEKVKSYADGPEVMTPEVLNGLTHLNATLSKPGIDGLFGIQFFIKAIENEGRITEFAKRLGLAEDMPLIDKRAAYIAWARGEETFNGKPLDVENNGDRYYGAVNKNRKRIQNKLDDGQGTGGKARQSTVVSMTRSEDGSDAVEYDAGKQAFNKAGKEGDAELEKFMAYRVTLDLIAAELYRLLKETGDDDIADYLAARRAIWGQDQGRYIDNLNAARQLRPKPGTPYEELTPAKAITLDNKLDARIEILAKEFEDAGRPDLAEDIRSTRLGINRAGENSTMSFEGNQMGPDTLDRLNTLLDEAATLPPTGSVAQRLLATHHMADIKANPLAYALATGQIKNVGEGLEFIASSVSPLSNLAKYLVEQTIGIKHVPVFANIAKGAGGMFMSRLGYVTMNINMKERFLTTAFVHEALHALIYNKINQALQQVSDSEGMGSIFTRKGPDYIALIVKAAKSGDTYSPGLGKIAKAYLEFLDTKNMSQVQRESVGVVQSPKGWNDELHARYNRGEIENEDWEGEFFIDYAMLNIQEFIAVGLTDSYVARTLSRISPESPDTTINPKTVLTGFMEALTDIAYDLKDRKITPELKASIQGSLMSRLLQGFSEETDSNIVAWEYDKALTVADSRKSSTNQPRVFRLTEDGRIMSLDRLSSTPQSVRFNQTAPVSAGAKAQNDLKAAKGRLYKALEDFNLTSKGKPVKELDLGKNPEFTNISGQPIIFSPVINVNTTGAEFSSRFADGPTILSEEAGASGNSIKVVLNTQEGNTLFLKGRAERDGNLSGESIFYLDKHESLKLSGVADEDWGELSVNDIVAQAQRGGYRAVSITGTRSFMDKRKGKAWKNYVIPLVREDVLIEGVDRVVMPKAHPTLADAIKNNKAFKTWFKDSAVTHTDGRPMVMYHGTTAVFDHFQADETPDTWYGMGAYFTDNPNVAGEYASTRTASNATRVDKGASIYPVLLSIKNPIDMDAEVDVKKWKKAMGPELWKAMYYDPADKWHNKMMFDALRMHYRDRMLGLAKYEVRDILVAMGYDGVTHTERSRFGYGADENHRVYIAFESTQVKSIFNRGTWSKTDPITLNQLRDESVLGKRISVEGDAGKDVLGMEKQLVALKATVESRRRDLLGMGLHEETEPRDYVYIKDILKGVAPLSEPSSLKILDRIGKIVDPTAPVFNTMRPIGNYRSLNDNDRKAFVLDVVTKKIQNQMGDRYAETGIFSPITASVVGKRVRRLIGGGVDYHATADSDSVFLQFISKIYDPMMDLRNGELKGMLDMPSVDKVNVKLTNMFVKSGLMQAMDKVQGEAKNNAELTAINNMAWSYLARVGDLPADIAHRSLVLEVITATNKFNTLANEMLVSGGMMHGGADPLAYGTIRAASKLAYKDRAGFVKALHAQALRTVQANSKTGEMSVITAEALGWLSLRREDGSTDAITHVDIDLTSRLYEPLKAKVKDFDGKMEWNSKTKKVFSEILNDLDTETRALHDNGLISSKNYTELWKRAAGSRPDDVTALYTTMEIAGNRYLGLDDLSSSKSAKPRSESSGSGRKYGEERILTHNEIASNPELAKYFSQDIFSLVNSQMRNQLQDLAMTNEITNFFGGNVRLSMLDLIEVLNKTGEEYLGKSKLTVEEIKTRQRGYDRVKTAWESHTGKLARSQDSIDSYLAHLLENSRVPVMVVGGVRAALSSVPELARAILASDHNKGMLRQLFPNIFKALKLTRHSKRSQILEMSSSVHWIRHMASEHLMAKSSLMPDNPFNNVAFGGKQSGWFSSWANEWEAISGINELETSGFARGMNRASMVARMAGGPLTFINKVTTTLHIHNAQLNLSKNSAKFMRLATLLQENPAANLPSFSALARSCGLTAKEALDLSSAGLLDPKYIQVLIDATKDQKNMTDGMLDVRKLMTWAQENPDTMAIREEAITRLGGYIGMTTRHTNTEPTLLDLRIAQSTFGKALNVFMQFLLSHSVQEIGRNRRYTKSSYARHLSGLLAMEVTANAMLRAYAGEDPREEFERNPVEYITKVSTSMPLLGSYQWLGAAMRQGAYASYEAVTGEDTFKEQVHIPGPLDAPINNAGDRAKRGTIWAIDTLRESF